MRPININFHQEKIFVLYIFIQGHNVKTGIRLDVLYSEYVNVCKTKLNTKYIFGIAKFTEILQELGGKRYTPRISKNGSIRHRYWKIPADIPIQEVFRYMQAETDRLLERLRRNK